MHRIDTEDHGSEFERCWKAAGKHIQGMAQGPLHSWLKADLNPPFLAHLSFRLGNQLFFIRLEDVDGRLETPGNRSGLAAISSGCNGYACIMPMQLLSRGWEPAAAGWSLMDANTHKAIDPLACVTDQKIEMTDWELHDFSVQVVKDHLRKSGRSLISWQGNPAVVPSIWFEGDAGPEWVVVRAARYPSLTAPAPGNWQAISDACAEQGDTGHFASVVVASADDAFDPSGTIPATPLWRGYGMMVRFAGLDRRT